MVEEIVTPSVVVSVVIFSLALFLVRQKVHLNFPWAYWAKLWTGWSWKKKTKRKKTLFMACPTLTRSVMRQIAIESKRMKQQQPSGGSMEGVHYFSGERRRRRRIGTVDRITGNSHGMCHLPIGLANKGLLFKVTFHSVMFCWPGCAVWYFVVPVHYAIWLNWTSNSLVSDSQNPSIIEWVG